MQDFPKPSASGCPFSYWNTLYISDIYWIYAIAFQTKENTKYISRRSHIQTQQVQQLLGTLASKCFKPGEQTCFLQQNRLLSLEAVFLFFEKQLVCLALGIYNKQQKTPTKTTKTGPSVALLRGLQIHGLFLQKTRLSGVRAELRAAAKRGGDGEVSFLAPLKKQENNNYIAYSVSFFK